MWESVGGECGGYGKVCWGVGEGEERLRYGGVGKDVRKCVGV